MSPVRLLVLAAPLFLSASASAQTVLLRYRPPVGKTASYTMSMTMTMTTAQKMPGARGPIKMTSPVSLRVISKTADTTTIETKTGPMKGGPGTPMGAGSKPQVVRMTLDQYGTPRGGAGAGAAAAMMNSMGQNMQGVVFPKKPLKVGDTWTQTIDLGKTLNSAGTMGGMKMQSKLPMVYRLVTLKNGIATIAMTAKGTMTMAMGARTMQTSLNIRTTSQIDAATGLARSTSMVNDSVIQVPGMGAMRQHMTMTMK